MSDEQLYGLNIDQVNRIRESIELTDQLDPATGTYGIGYGDGMDMFAYIDSQESDTQYTAHQVISSGTAFIEMEKMDAIQWGDGKPAGWLNGIATSALAEGTIVRVYPDADSNANLQWFFNVNGSSIVTHPWMAADTGSSDMATIKVAWLYPQFHDSVTIFDELTNTQDEILAVSAPSAYEIDVSTVVGDGIVYVKVIYNGSYGWVIEDETTTPLNTIAVASWPPNNAAENIDVFYFPICRYTDQGTSDFKVSQLAFENPTFNVRKFMQPFKGRVKDTSALNQIEIGYMRTHGSYGLVDTIGIMDEEGVFNTIADSGVNTSPVLTGSGYLWYELQQNTSGVWSLRDNSGTPIFNGAAFPPSEDFAALYLLLGRYEDAGGAFKWFQELEENPVLQTRKCDHYLNPQYVMDGAVPSVKIRDGHFYSIVTSGAITGITLPLSGATDVWVEVVSEPGTAPAITAAVQSGSFPGHVNVPGTGILTTAYLIGHVASGAYVVTHTGALFAGTLWQPNIDNDIKYIDNQGVQLLGRESVASVEGSGVANSLFFQGKTWDVHFRAGMIKSENTGPAVKYGGTDDDITAQDLISAVYGATGVINVQTRSFTHELTSGLSTKNALAAASNVTISFSEITVVTAVQLSGDILQIKTRDIRVFDDGTESGWTNVTNWGTTGCQ